MLDETKVEGEEEEKPADGEDTGEPVGATA